ncbi:hypothetical protein ACERK3_03810 [Phycisphaerales bacterium AB-hyl4]|uniref:Uncharacterized protein n=1 Tax=Natronomicrosphaera hydrolytica TaxID=3242702 RepID=A0ABV4U3S1_9BACT
MSMTSEQTLWRRMRFTPVSDALRGRLTGRLDVDQLIAEARLPAGPAQRVREVVHRTRLWRGEKIDVAHELIAHFRDGLDHEVPVEELVSSFGDAKQAARLIRRAKKRNRPWPWHVARAMSLAVCVLVGVYVVASLLLMLDRPAVTVDYVTQLNERAMAVPEEDRAWPIYREVLLSGVLRDGIDPITVRRQGRSRSVIRAGEPGWDEAVAFLHDRREALDMIREAAAKPGLGLPIGYVRDFTGLDREALYGPDHGGLSRPSEGKANVSYVDQLADESIVNVILPHLGYMRMMARLLSADTEQAWEQGDHERVLVNLSTMFGLARHSRETPIVLNSLMAVSIISIAQQQVADLLHRDAQRWSRAELAKLAHLLAGVDPLVQPAFEGERMFMYDWLQRFYSQRGFVTRDGLRFFHTAEFHGPHREDTRPYAWAISTAGLPLANILMASRSEVKREYDELMTILEAESAMPYWERMHRSPTDEAVEALVTDTFRGIRYLPIAIFMPALTASLGTRDRVLALRDALHVVIAMELHHRDHGEYPADLASLSPRYLPTPPVDHSTGDPLRVRYTDDGDFILYGLGHNGEDNGGTLSDDGRNRWPGVSNTGDWVLYPPVIRPVQAEDDPQS